MNKLLLSLVFLKEPDARAWATLDPRVRAIAMEVAHLAKRFGRSVIVTSTVRDKGIHEQRCAVDMDFSGEDGPEKNRFGRLAAKYINRTWCYGNSWFGKPKPCALWHKGTPTNGGDGWHLHLQVPPSRDMKVLPP